MGCLNPWEIKENYQIWRLFTTLFLSVGFSNYAISSVCLLIIGFMIESSKMGIARMAVFYMLCGGIGSLFSALISSDLSCGNFSAIMALDSGLMALVIRNWKALLGVGPYIPLRIILLFVVIFIFIISLLMTAST